MPLPQTGVEVEGLRDRFGRDVTTLLRGAEATEARLRAAVKGKRFVHVATHGFAREDLLAGLYTRKIEEAFISADAERQLAVGHDPMLLSGLAMAGANPRDGTAGDDGILTALEASYLDLDGVDVVTLSACETAKGTAESGEGVQGLVSALEMAGAHRVLASLWRVDDEGTQRLMDGTYERMLRPGNPLVPADALREAARSLRDSKDASGKARFAAPRYWSAFVCYERLAAQRLPSGCVPREQRPPRPRRRWDAATEPRDREPLARARTDRPGTRGHSRLRDSAHRGRPAPPSGRQTTSAGCLELCPVRVAAGTGTVLGAPCRWSDVGYEQHTNDRFGLLVMSHAAPVPAMDPATPVCEAPRPPPTDPTEMRPGLTADEVCRRLARAARHEETGRRVLAFYLVEMDERRLYQATGHGSTAHYAEARLGLIDGASRSSVRVGAEVLELREARSRAFSARGAWGGPRS